MAQLERHSENEFSVSGNAAKITFDKEKYEDLFYAVPEEAGKYMANGHFYRLWTDDIAQTQEERDAVNTILGEGQVREAALTALQDQIKKITP